MKITARLLVVFAGVLLLANATYAQSRRMQLNQLVDQLQKSPDDDALREKIIRLAKTIVPSPAMPAEAQRRIVRGTVAFKGAKSPKDYQAAAMEFEQATLAAPWSADAYFNLGLAQDKAEDYEGSLRSLKHALLVSPESKDIQDLYYEVEYRKDKAAEQKSEAAKAAAAAASAQANADSKKAAFIDSIRGNWGDRNIAFSITPIPGGDVKITYVDTGMDYSPSAAKSSYRPVSDIRITPSGLEFTVVVNNQGNPERSFHYKLSPFNSRLFGSVTYSNTESGKAMIRQLGWNPGADQTFDSTFVRQ